MTGGVYSACGETKSTVALIAEGQPSHAASTMLPGLNVATAVSGTKNRSRRRVSGSKLATASARRHPFARSIIDLGDFPVCRRHDIFALDNPALLRHHRGRGIEVFRRRAYFRLSPQRDA